MQLYGHCQVCTHKRSKSQSPVAFNATTNIRAHGIEADPSTVDNFLSVLARMAVRACELDWDVFELDAAVVFCPKFWGSNQPRVGVITILEAPT